MAIIPGSSNFQSHSPRILMQTWLVPMTGLDQSYKELCPHWCTSIAHVLHGCAAMIPAVADIMMTMRATMATRPFMFGEQVGPSASPTFARSESQSEHDATEVVADGYPANEVQTMLLFSSGSPGSAGSTQVHPKTIKLLTTQLEKNIQARYLIGPNYAVPLSVSA